MILALCVGLIQIGGRVDNVVGGAKDAKALKPATCSLDEDLNCLIAYKKSKTGRLGGSVLQCCCAVDGVKFCLPHSLSRRFAAVFPISWETAEAVLSALGPGYGLHSFRRTLALACRIHWGDVFCLNNIRSINRHFLWSETSSEFWSYSWDVDDWRAVAFLVPTFKIV